jgi:Ser/Thr protein kinase RdoA (MazF antagonist)
MTRSENEPQPTPRDAGGGINDASLPGEILGAPGEGPLRGWETYSDAELTRVLTRFDLGRVYKMDPYRRGSRSAPKVKIAAERGEFLLKRRVLSRHPVSRIRYSQSLQAALGRQGFPVAPLMAVRDTGDTLLTAEEHAYELFRFVVGDRFDKSERGAEKAGETLARFHVLTRDFDTSMALQASFHSSPLIPAAIGRVTESVERVEPHVNRRSLATVVAYLGDAYARAVDEIEGLGFAGLPSHAVHGDWHPGNLIYYRGLHNLAVAAVIDFDSTRSEPWVTELANAMAQFSIRGEPGTSPLTWPADFDARRMQALLRGYLGGYLGATDHALSAEERGMIPWLMIEAIIAESVVPIANQGSFAELSGSSFLELVARKCDWVRQHRKAIAAL